ncbi:MAG: M1 family metallopeptidase [Rhizomicrobium sp.]
MLSADEIIAYTNNSPNDLDYLWLQLDQNIYRPNSRGTFAFGMANRKPTEGYVFDSVEANGARTATVVSDTRGQLRLAQPLKAHSQIAIHIRYHYVVPGKSGGRTAHVPSKNGEIYDIAQWFPRMAVYDDLRGWDTLPYLVSEFYLDYGDIDYSVTVPSDMLVAGSGELVNPEEVLTKTQLDRLSQARSSDKTVMIRTAAEVNDPASRPKQGGTLTWHFKMANTRDVAFGASKAFVWDAARINLPGGKTALAQSVYPAEAAAKPDGWSHSTEYMKDSVENFSRRWYPFAWPNAVAVGGPVGGMEYPALVFDGMTTTGKDLFWLTAHEIGHSWFPMTVGFNERRDPWMDEGFNTFIDVFESEDFNHGIYGPKRDAEFAPKSAHPADGLVALLADPKAPVMLTAGDQVIEDYRHYVSYYKSAFGMVLLRDTILGPDRFDYAFRKFIRDWAYKHPSPSDFFRAMESAGGEDLSWFWREWYFSTGTYDVAVTSVTPAKGGWKNGATITLENRDTMVFPVTLAVRYDDGHTMRVAVPVEAWMRRTGAIVPLGGDRPVVSVVADPDHALPDRDRSNNAWGTR